MRRVRSISLILGSVMIVIGATAAQNACLQGAACMRAPTKIPAR